MILGVSGLSLVYFFLILFFYRRLAGSGPLVLEGPPSGYLIPEARLVTHGESPPAVRIIQSLLWIQV